MTTVNKPHKPYKISVVWIDGEDKTFSVQSHQEDDHGITIVLNNRQNTVRYIPYTNMKFYDFEVE